jgi:hypothetical protein
MPASTAKSHHFSFGTRPDLPLAARWAREVSAAPVINMGIAEIQKQAKASGRRFAAI